MEIIVQKVRAKIFSNETILVKLFQQSINEYIPPNRKNRIVSSVFRQYKG